MKMNTRTVSACALATVVGSCLALAQPAQDQQLPPRTTTTTMNNSSPSMSAMRMYASADKLRGSTVENAAKKNIGTVSDLVIDRGSGAVTYVVLNAGGFLGIGTKKVVIPFSNFGWDSSARQLTLEATPENAKMWPLFEEKNWAGTSDSLSNKLSQDYYRTPQNYYPSTTSTSDTHVKGTVTRVDRRSIPRTNTEEMLVTVRTDDGREEQIVLGPSYYMSGTSNTIYRDAPIDVLVTRVERDGRPVAVARSYNVNSKDTALYDNSGKAHWWSSKSNSSEPIGYPFLLNSDIDGKHIQARGEKCGKVDDLIVETGTGRVVFLSIDPDQNVLGIGDTKRLIPWGVAMVITKDDVLLDATKAMITSAPETPKDLALVSSDAKYQNIYQGYGISEPYYYDSEWRNNNMNNPNRRDRDLRDTSGREREPK
ncbi:MAG: PRC-barrel domain-containing protein [Phycisphaerales bacterium]